MPAKAQYIWEMFNTFYIFVESTNGSIQYEYPYQLRQKDVIIQGSLVYGRVSLTLFWGDSTTLDSVITQSLQTIQALGSS